MADDEEQMVLDAVLDYLSRAGQSVRVLRRPDREDRIRRAVDFEVAVDGRKVGVEVASASAFIEDFQAIGRVETAVEADLNRFAKEPQLGQWVLRMRWFERPRQRDTARLKERVTSELRRGLLPGRDLAQMVDPPHPIKSATLTRVGAGPHMVRGVSAPVPGWWVEGQVDDFIEWLIDRKATQGAEYPELWIVIFARTPVFGGDDLQDGLERRREKVPAHWRRIFYVDGGGVTEALT